MKSTSRENCEGPNKSSKKDEIVVCECLPHPLRKLVRAVTSSYVAIFQTVEEKGDDLVTSSFMTT
jgi:hypothetical protein